MSVFTYLDILEYPLIKSFQTFDGTLLDYFFLSVSNIPLMLIFFGIVIGYLIWQKNALWKPLLFAVITSALISYSINEGFFKMLLTEIGVFRPRPWTIHPDIIAIGHTFRDSSFPSSHMAFTTLLITIVTHFEKRFLKYGVIIILLMGLSRVHNGMHYPSDVLIGTILGLLYGYAGLTLMRKFGLEKKSWWKKLFR